MGKTLAHVAIVLLLCSLVLVLPVAATGVAKNVWMFYVCGDNELNPEGMLNLIRAAGGSNDDVKIIAMVDNLGTANPARDIEDGIYYITGSASTDIKLWTPPAELNMGDPASLAFFINYVHANYPADRYMMTIWDHGSGYRGVFSDWHPGSSLTIKNLGATLAASGVHFDLLQFEACLMDMAEVGYELRNSANIMVASEESDYMSRPYTKIIGWLKANPQASAANLGIQIVDGYFDRAPPPNRGTLAVIDLKQMSAVANSMDNLGDLLIPYMPEWQSAILTAGSATQRYSWRDYADIIDFTNKLDAQISDPQVQTATAAVRTAVRSAVLYERHKGSDLQNSHGLSAWIFGGSGDPDGAFAGNLQVHRTLQFAADTSWDEFNVELRKTPITIASPNGGEDWQAGTTHLITWTQAGREGTNVEINLYKVQKVRLPNGAYLYFPVFENNIVILPAARGFYSWPIPTTQTSSSFYLVEVKDHSNPAFYDRSDGNFTISGMVHVTSPNGGETWQRGTSHTVTWSYTGSPGTTVKLVLLKAGAEVSTIVSGVPTGTGGTGSYTWPIGSSPTLTTGSDFQVRVESLSQPTIKDASNSYFNLTPAGTTPPSITVTSPACGVAWQPGTPHTVTWTYTGDPGSYVKVVLLKGGVAVGTATYSTSIGSSGTGSYQWAISSTRAPSTDYQILVQSTSQPTVKGTSCTFTIGQPSTTPTITVTAPNGGEVWKRGTPHTVTWKYTGNPGSYVKVVLMKAGVDVGTATYSTSIGTSGIGSYSWAISSTRAAGTDYKIRVESLSQSTIKDISNNYFTISS